MAETLRIGIPNLAPDELENIYCPECHLNPFHQRNGDFNYTCQGPEQAKGNRIRRTPPYDVITSMVTLKPKYTGIDSDLLSEVLDPNKSLDDINAEIGLPTGFESGLKHSMRCGTWAEEIKDRT